jgi:hypothetical protein
MPPRTLFRIRLIARFLLLVVVAIVGNSAIAQDLAPRAYWPTPNGANVLALAYQYSTGDVLIDASLPLTGVDSDIDVFQLSYQRTFGLWGRTTTMQFNLPYSEGITEGLVNGVQQRRDISGLADIRVRFAINIKGAPSMDRAAFQALRQNPETIVGVSLLVQAPTGEYESDEVINLGTNRWSVKPAIGLIKPLHPTLLFEFEAGVWLFGDNDEFLGETRQQNPMLSTEFHLIKRIRPGFWASLDANFYVGGSTTISGSESKNMQRDARIGATVAFPIEGRHALRGTISTGAVSESGGDYDRFSLTYVYAW